MTPHWYPSSKLLGAKLPSVYGLCLLFCSLQELHDTNVTQTGIRSGKDMTLFPCLVGRGVFGLRPVF